MATATDSIYRKRNYEMNAIRAEIDHALEDLCSYRDDAGISRLISLMNQLARILEQETKTLEDYTADR